MLQLFRRSVTDTPAVWTEDRLTATLQALYDEEPSLRPDARFHDYPLTYPPAIVLERQPDRARPSDAEWAREGVGQLRGAAWYFHFGFCKYRCRYCFHYEIRTSREEERMARYVKALSREIRAVRALTPGVKSGLYFLGGGTPTALPERLLGEFLDDLLQQLGPPPTCMSTVEAKPVTADNPKLDLLINAGFRRINLGVQTLDADLYGKHHHGEKLEVALDAIDRARARGFEFVNIDLMTGLPGQTPASFERTLDSLDRLIQRGAIDSVFLYPYHDDPRSRTFGTDEGLQSFVRIAHSEALFRARLEAHGWSELGARFFRSPRHVRRELRELARIRINPAYGEVMYHGFGNSSFSLGDRATWLNHRDLDAYCTAVESGSGLGVSRWTPLDDAARATRDVSFDLLYSPYTRVRSRARRYGEAAMSHHRQKLDRWAALGLGQHHRLAGTFSLSALGKLVHQQMIPQHYALHDRQALARVMADRLAEGKAYRGY